MYILQGGFFDHEIFLSHRNSSYWRLPRKSSQRLTSAIIWPRESLFKVHCSQTILYPRDSFDPLDVIPFGNLTHLGYITLKIEDSTCHFNILCQSTYNEIIVKSSKTYTCCIERLNLLKLQWKFVPSKNLYFWQWKYLQWVRYSSFLITQGKLTAYIWN